MIKLITLISISILCINCPNVCAQSDAKLSNLGLVGEMAYNKRTAETHAIRIFNHYALSDAEKSVMITKYNDLRIKEDQLIMQMISDLLKKKSISNFKKVDKYFLKGKKKNNKYVQSFLVNWNQVTASYDEMIQYPTQIYLDSMVAEYTERQNEELEFENPTDNMKPDNVKVNPADPMGSVGSLFGVYKTLKINSAQKAMNITELLNAMRLRDASELVADEGELIETKLEPEKKE